jgi:hypothetical protein
VERRAGSHCGEPAVNVEELARPALFKWLLLVNWIMRLVECLVTQTHLKNIAIGVLR